MSTLEGSDQSQSESLIEALVGEGKKYSTVEELAKARLEADNFIDTLKEENAELRKLAQEKATIKDVMDALKSQKTDSNSDSVTPLDDEDLQKRITELMESREADTTRKANRSEAKKLVSDRLNSSDEETINEFVKNKAQSLGMSVDDLWELSEKSPHGFANLTGVSGSRPNTGNPASLPGQHNSESSSGAAVMEIDGHKTKAWFDAQRKAMGNRKFINDPSMQSAQIRSREKLGDRYYS
jgi:hypothetical protein